MASPELTSILLALKVLSLGLLELYCHRSRILIYVLLGSGVSLCNKQYPLKIVLIMKSGHVLFDRGR